MFSNMYIAIICFPVCDVVNFETNLFFFSKSLSHVTKKSEQKLKNRKSEKSFWHEIKKSHCS